MGVGLHVKFDVDLCIKLDVNLDIEIYIVLDNELALKLGNNLGVKLDVEPVVKLVVNLGVRLSLKLGIDLLPLPLSIDLGVKAGAGFVPLLCFFTSCFFPSSFFFISLLLYFLFPLQWVGDLFHGCCALTHYLSADPRGCGVSQLEARDRCVYIATQGSRGQR